MQLPSCMGILGKTVCVEPSYSACTPESSSFQPISPWLNSSPTDAHDTPGILHEMDCRYPDFSMFVARRDSDMFADLCVTKTELRAAKDIIKKLKASHTGKSQTNEARLLRNELVAACREIDRLRKTVDEKDAEISNLNNELQGREGLVRN